MMKFKTGAVTAPKEILANDHYVGYAVNFEGWDNAVDGIAKAGSIYPANDASAAGVVLYDVNLNENPNGTIVVHGFIKEAKLPEAPSAEAKQALKQIGFIPEY